jgi:Pro-kumamolisin, activation domain/Bacterial Ig-like domain (group 3)
MAGSTRLKSIELIVGVEVPFEFHTGQEPGKKRRWGVPSSRAARLCGDFYPVPEVLPVMQTMQVCRSRSSFSSSSVFHFSLITAIFFATILCSAMQGQEAAQPAAVRAPLITQPLDESRLTTLKGNTHPLARPLFDLGTAPASLPMERMLLVLKRSPEQEAAVRKLLDDQQDKGSPNYHKWLTPEQFGKQFGPSDSDIQAITSWLQSRGFQVGTTKGRTVLEFSGSASQVKEAFHTTIHKYAVNGEQHWANASDPQIPTALTPVVAGIKTLHNFLKKPALHVSEKRLLAKLVPGARPQFTGSGGTHALAPGDFATIYNAGPAGIDGTGITIAVVARNNLFNGGSDISDFRNVFALPATPPLNIILNGPDPGDQGGNEEFEATLDASWSGAIATGATVDFVVSASTNTTDGVDLSELYIIENNLGSVMTESFSSCESGLTAADGQGISALAEQAAAQGITYLLATGDTGAEGCDNLSETTATGGVFVSALAATPFTVAVGGTMFNEGSGTYWNTTNDTALASAVSYIPEDVWNETCTTACQSGQPPLAAGGGGASVLFPKPTWQTGVTGIPPGNARYLPDVSLTAAGHDPYLLCVEASCVPDAQNNISFSGVEGTSASTPSFASILALVDEKMSQGPEGASGARQGQADYVLYQLAAQQQKALGTACNASGTSLPNSACVFYDVTVGNNSVPGETGYPTGQYSSTAGFDLASGLGSVNITNLVNKWSTVSFPATTTTITLNGVAGGNTIAVPLTHGTSVATVVGTVKASSGTPTGDVALIAGGQTSSRSNQSGIAMFTLSSGNISGSTTQLPGGTYTVTAHYAGDGTFAPSDSSPGVLVAVTPEGSTTTLAGPFTTDTNGNYSVPFTSTPFGSPILLSASVAGASGAGTPTGTVTFSTTTGTIPNTSSPALNSNGVASLISNPFLLSGPVVPFDEGTYTISATYNHDSSFNTSSSTPVSFTIQSGFVGVSGPTDVTIASPGGSGTTTVGIIASSKFTTAIAFTCSGLPSEAACSPVSATGKGPGTVVSTKITVTTTAPHTTMLQSNERRYYYAVVFGGGLPLAGILLVASPKRRRWSTVLGLMVLALLVTVPACGGGGGSSHQQDPGTPAGTYTVTVTATAGSLSTSGPFTLTVQ